MVDDIDIFTFLKSEYNKDSTMFFNVHEIMEALEVDEEDILLVKNPLEDGVDAGDYERRIAKDKAWYRYREIDE